MRSRLEVLFPALRRQGYIVTSPETESYNCVAWAAGDDERWWEPDPYYQHHWPLRTRDYRVETYVQAFQTIGYEDCGSDASLEAGFEKLAVYADSSVVRHMARQLPSGRWTSKCGRLEDITHENPSSLEGSEYGKVALIMKRPM